MKIFIKLAGYLVQLPTGYPRTKSGVELRILRQLFTPENASLAIHISLIPEEPRVIAYRAGITVREAERKLEEMDRKGLIFSTQSEGVPIKYRIQQFVVRFWEGQVNNLTPELVRDSEEYLPDFINLDLWQKVPQLRTIPIEKSVNVSTLLQRKPESEQPYVPKSLNYISSYLIPCSKPSMAYH